MGEVVVYVDKTDQDDRWTGVYVSDMRGRQQPNIIMAKRGRMKADISRMAVTIVLEDGTLHSTGTSAYPHTCTIANPANTFTGVWESSIGTLEFENAGAVGSADIAVLAEGKLRITDNWTTEAILTVATTTASAGASTVTIALPA